MRGLALTLIVPLCSGFMPRGARSPCRPFDLSRSAGESDYEADILSRYGTKKFVPAPAEFFTSYRWAPPTEEVARFVAPDGKEDKPWMNQVTQQNSDGGGLETSELGSITTTPVFGAIALALALGAFYNNFIYQSGSG